MFDDGFQQGLVAAGRGETQDPLDLQLAVQARGGNRAFADIDDRAQDAGRLIGRAQDFAGRPRTAPGASPSSSRWAARSERTSFETVGGLMPVSRTSSARDSPPWACTVSRIRRSFIRRSRLGRTCGCKSRCWDAVAGEVIRIHDFRTVRRPRGYYQTKPFHYPELNHESARPQV